ncbi:hypothetical protein GSF70_10295 [Flavobacteriaceae bacterium W22]|nr:hypothetical protein [Flavobacteriaceae bacterium W22]
MEQIIIIVLLIIIILILSERKISIDVRRKEASDIETDLPSMMGSTKQRERQALPIRDNERQVESPSMTVNNFDSETNEELLGNEGLSKNIDDILFKNVDWELEEEDWKYRYSNVESGFATGVTFQELSTVGQLLQEEVLESDLEKQAVDIIQKVHGTELFNLLENSLGEASKRISNLLKESISNDNEIIFSKKSNSSDSFDIGEFV